LPLQIFLRTSRSFRPIGGGGTFELYILTFGLRAGDVGYLPDLKGYDFMQNSFEQKNILQIFGFLFWAVKESEAVKIPSRHHILDHFWVSSQIATKIRP